MQPLLLSAGPSPLELALAERDAGGLFVVNDSGGKDSQAMMIYLSGLIPPEQLLTVHATLGESEWPGALEHARAHAEAAGASFLVAQAGKTFLEMVERRYQTRPDVPCWPSSAHRQCTSDLKRGPITREVRRYADQHGFKRIVNCMGFRREESPARAKKVVWKEHGEHGRAGRSWYDWLPIHEYSVQDVFRTVREAGQELHPAYQGGNERLSCMFCIFGSANDLRHGAQQNPELYRKYVELERRTGYTMHVTQKSLETLTGVAAG